MGRKKLYESETAKKAALALKKKQKRAENNIAKKLLEAEKTNFQWVSQILLKLVNDIPRKVEILNARRQRHADQRAIKRKAIREAANILPKRQKYSK